MNKKNIKRVLEWLRFKNVKLKPDVLKPKPYDVETFKQCLVDSLGVCSEENKEQIKIVMKILED